MRLSKTSKFICVVLLPGLFSSCGDCKYVVTKDYIKSNCEMTYGFYFEEIDVDSVDKEGVPAKYETVKLISLGLSEEGLKSAKKIFFYQETENYVWHNIKEHSLHSTLPVRMEPGHWYMIRALMFLGNPDKKVFIHVDEKGEYHIYSPPIKTNW